MDSDRLIISYHPSFSEEKKYTLSLLFEHFLGFDCQFQEHLHESYEIILPNQNKLIIDDAFFASISSESYLDTKNLPKPSNNSAFFSNDVLNCLVLFGKSEYLPDKSSEFYAIHWKNDIIAASFLMLSRWEESIQGTKRDDLGRFPEEEHLSVRYNFAHRPVVNEFLNGLKIAVKELGGRIPESTRMYRVFPEHDIDVAERFPDVIRWIKSLMGDLLQGRGSGVVRNTWKSGVEKFVKKGIDPFEKYDFLMDISEASELKSCFYFIGGQGIDSDSYPFQSRRLYGNMQKIKARGHGAAFHPGLDTYNNPELYAIELKRVHQLIPEAQLVRQHYLQFKLPHTLRLAEQNGLKTDTSLGFKERVGFRNGICYTYPFFDVLLRKKMSVEVSSFCLMDMALWRMGVSGQEALQIFKNLAETIRLYQGDFRFIWHNSSFEVAEWIELSALYKEYVQIIK